MKYEILIDNQNYEVDKSVYELVKSLRIELGIQKYNWNELKTLVIDKAHFYEDKGYMHQGAILVDVVEEIEQLEKENE